jgi:uncharacterized damage-inducible protein DinB
MPETREKLLAHYHNMRDQLLAAIEGLSDEQLSDPSLDGWSVKDHLFHVALWDDVRAQEVARISAGNDSAWRMSDEQDAAYNDMAYDLRRDLAASQAKWELESSRNKLLDAIANATERGLDAALYGEAGLVSTHQAEHAGWIKAWRASKGI